MLFTLITVIARSTVVILGTARHTEALLVGKNCADRARWTGSGLAGRDRAIPTGAIDVTAHSRRALRAALTGVTDLSVARENDERERDEEN